MKVKLTEPCSREVFCHQIGRSACAALARPLNKASLLDRYPMHGYSGRESTASMNSLAAMLLDVNENTPNVLTQVKAWEMNYATSVWQERCHSIYSST